MKLPKELQKKLRSNITRHVKQFCRTNYIPPAEYSVVWTRLYTAVKNYSSVDLLQLAKQKKSRSALDMAESNGLLLTVARCALTELSITDSPIIPILREISVWERNELGIQVRKKRLVQSEMDF